MLKQDGEPWPRITRAILYKCKQHSLRKRVTVQSKRTRLLYSPKDTPLSIKCITPTKLIRVCK